MENTYQFKDINMLQHGEMVFNEYEKLLSAIKNKNEEYFKKECVPDYEDAARQFVKQFEGEECMAFVVALKKELERIIQEDEYKRNQAKGLPGGGDNPSEKCPD